MTKFDCEYCGKPNEQQSSRYRQKEHHYCDHRCAQAAHSEKMNPRVNTPLTATQILALTGSMLGDGYLVKRKGEFANPHFAMRHGIDQLEYLSWKARIFSNLLPNPEKPVVTYKNCVATETFTLSALSAVYQKWYPDGHHKVLPEDIADYLHPLALAIWQMDDGSFNYPRIRIATHGFTFDEVHRLSAAIQMRYGWTAKVCTAHFPDYGDYPFLSLTAASRDGFVETILSNVDVPESMKYKFSGRVETRQLGCPSGHQGIVRTAGRLADLGRNDQGACEEITGHESNRIASITVLGPAVRLMPLIKSAPLGKATTSAQVKPCELLETVKMNDHQAISSQAWQGCQEGSETRSVPSRPEDEASTSAGTAVSLPYDMARHSGKPETESKQLRLTA